MFASPVAQVTSSNYILAVDDIPDNLFLIKLALEQEGHEVFLLDNGQKAIEQVKKSPPSLILLDVMMPGMDGYEVTRRIRQDSSLPFIPILLITAHEESSVVEGLDAGADEFIRKPVKIDELQARVRSLLRLKQTIDQREDFVSCLTHDLRTPLVACDRMLSLMQQGIFGQVPPPMDKAIGDIMKSNQNLLQMLNQLLEVHCYEVGEKIVSFIKFNLRELSKDVITELTPIAKEKNLDLRLCWKTDKEEIIGDRLELRRVLTNLINNAIKFTDTGFVELRFSHVPHSHAIVMEVEDTGMGISPELQPHIFNRYRQGNHKRSGHGLGLYLCQRIVRTHQGTIEFKSELEKGTVFTLRLPISPEFAEFDGKEN
jgi:two-component system, sensor histidine kinase and response regulator